MFSIDGVVRDIDQRLISGAKVYVYLRGGELADLFDSVGASLSNPISTDALGYFQAFVAASDFYTFKYFYEGRVRYVDANRLVGVDPLETSVHLAVVLETMTAGGWYPSLAAGAADTTDGEGFFVTEAGLTPGMAKFYNAQNVAGTGVKLAEFLTLAASRTIGFSSRSQVSLSASTVLDAETYSGANILVGTAGVVITLPSTGFESGLAVAISNISSGPITLTAPGGTDAPVTLSAGRSLMLFADGTGYWRSYFHSASPDAMVRVATRSAMSVLPAAVVGSTCYLTEGARSGLFVLKAGSTPTDPQQGLYVASATAGFYWARQWDGHTGRPEWFGGVAGDSSGGAQSANDAALPACVALCPNTQLQSSDYWISTTWKVQTQYRSITGGGYSDGYATGNGTRIICMNAAATVLQVGPDSAPASLSQYYRNIRVTNLCALHGVQLTAPVDRVNATKAIVANYLLDCEFERVYTWEALIGFYIYATVATYFKRCKSFRSATRLGSDFFYGFWARGTPAVAAGGNPSLYIQDCGVEIGGSITPRIALYVDGEPADLFVDKLESSACTNGILMEMSGLNTYGKQDIHFRNCVFDQCAGAAIDIQGLNAAGCITISGGYYQANTTATAVMWLRGGAGAITVDSGAEVVCGAFGATVGIYVNGQPNVTIGETVKILDCPTGVAADGASNGLRVTCTIYSPIIANATKPAIGLTAAKQAHIAPRITALANGWSQGVILIGTLNDKITIDPSRIDNAAISGGVNKVVVNGTNITTPGYFTGAGAAGTAGAGIHLTGITA